MPATPKKTSWTFQLSENDDFEVAIDVKNMGLSRITFWKVKLKRNDKGAVIGMDEEAIGSLTLPKSGKAGVNISIDSADRDPDTIYTAHCVAFKGVSPSNAWGWTLGVKQNGHPCPILWGPGAVETQCIGEDGVHDPCSDGYQFGSASFDASTILFDVVPPEKKGG